MGLVCLILYVLNMIERKLSLGSACVVVGLIVAFLLMRSLTLLSTDLLIMIGIGSTLLITVGVFFLYRAFYDYMRARKLL